jgi:hypothetical protein
MRSIAILVDSNFSTMPSSSQGGCPVTTNEYLYDTEETNRIRELAMGTLHEPPAPFSLTSPLPSGSLG